MSYSVLDLFGVRTAASYLAGIIADAQSLGLLVTSWRAGDPTRTMFTALARALGTKESALSELAKSAFLADCSGDWLTILALEVYNIQRVEATYATSYITVQNTGGGVYPIAARSWVFKNSVSGKTYRNMQAAPTLSPGGTAVLAVEAVEAGSASNALANEIDELVTTKLGVVVTASTVAVGLDAQDDEPLREQCRASRGALSPNGPADAYEYVARNPALTGVLDVTRANAVGDNPNLTVTVYIAGTTGPVAAPSVTAVQTALEQWATPLCITPTAVNATAAVFNLTFDITVGTALIPVDYEDLIEAALAAHFVALPIGAIVGVSALTAVVHQTIPGLTSVYSPGTYTILAPYEVPVLGTVTITLI